MTEPPPPRRNPITPAMAMLAALMNDHLDPGYAAAARRRAVSQPPSVTSVRLRRLVTVLTTAAIGLVLAIAYHQAVVQQPETARTRTALADNVRKRSAETDELQRDADRLRTQADREQDDALSDSANGRAVAGRLRELAGVTGLGAVRGPGVVVDVGDGPPPTDPVTGEPTGESDLGRVQDRDLQDLVNALWRAGAEAISVDGQRLTATSTIRAAGEAVLVDFRPVTSPYRIEAIGDPAAVYEQFTASGTAKRFDDYTRQYGMTFAAERVDRLTLRAGAQPQLRAAKPSEQPASPSASPR